MNCKQLLALLLTHQLSSIIYSGMGYFSLRPNSQGTHKYPAIQTEPPIFSNLSFKTILAAVLILKLSQQHKDHLEALEILAREARFSLRKGIRQVEKVFVRTRNTGESKVFFGRPEDASELQWHSVWGPWKFLTSAATSPTGKWNRIKTKKKEKSRSLFL